MNEPFPLDGGRAGLGVCAPVLTSRTLMGSDKDTSAHPHCSPNPQSHTPTQPSPIEGEGFHEMLAAPKRTLPPRWGKGRVGGARADGDVRTLMGSGKDAGAHPRSSLDLQGHTPTKPSPIEGEGFVGAA